MLDGVVESQDYNKVETDILLSFFELSKPLVLPKNSFCECELRSLHSGLALLHPQCMFVKSTRAEHGHRI